MKTQKGVDHTANQFEKEKHKVEKELSIRNSRIRTKHHDEGRAGLQDLPGRYYLSVVTQKVWLSTIGFHKY